MPPTRIEASSFFGKDYKTHTALNNLEFDQYRTEIAFVIAGIARAGSITTFIMGGYPSSETVQRYAHLAHDLKQIGLESEIVVFPKEGRTDLTIVFARRKTLIDSLIEMLNHPGANHQRYGEMCGIPQTAIGAFPADIFKKNGLPPEITNHPAFHFLNFSLSKDNYKKEWQYFLGQLGFVKTNFPAIANLLKLP